MPTTTLLADEITNLHVNSAAAIARSKLATDTKYHAIPLTDLRVFDDPRSVIPASPAADDLGLDEGTPGTTGPTVKSSDAKATTVTQKFLFRATLPPEYKAGGTVSLSLKCGLQTTVSDGTATIDASVYKKDEDDTTGAHGADLVSTGATSINSLTLAEVDFVITPTGLAEGDELTGIVTIAITDSATPTAVTGLVTRAALKLQVQG